MCVRWLCAEENAVLAHLGKAKRDDDEREETENFRSRSMEEKSEKLLLFPAIEWCRGFSLSMDFSSPANRGKFLCWSKTKWKIENFVQRIWVQLETFVRKIETEVNLHFRTLSYARKRDDDFRKRCKYMRSSRKWFIAQLPSATLLLSLKSFFPEHCSISSRRIYSRCKSAESRSDWNVVKTTLLVEKWSERALRSGLGDMMNDQELEAFMESSRRPRNSTSPWLRNVEACIACNWIFPVNKDV